MKKISIRTIFFRGIALAVPLGIIGYVFFRIIQIFEKIMTPIASRLNIQRLFGEITVTVFAIILLLIIFFILGLLMFIPAVAGLRSGLEDIILKLVPSLNQFKQMTAEKMEMQNATAAWKPVLILRDEEYAPAYITDESDQWVTIVFVKGTHSEPDDIIIAKKSSVVYKEIAIGQVKRFNRLYGKGYIQLIEKADMK